MTTTPFTPKHFTSKRNAYPIPPHQINPKRHYTLYSRRKEREAHRRVHYVPITAARGLFNFGSSRGAPQEWREREISDIPGRECSSVEKSIGHWRAANGRPSRDNRAARGSLSIRFISHYRARKRDRPETVPR